MSSIAIGSKIRSTASPLRASAVSIERLLFCRSRF